jgi:indolepyruvate ferredoxin oxidoreductase alpha subunit
MNTRKRQVLSGNEAVARGAFEAGVRVCTGYPGTPATEILEAASRYPGVYAEWSVNEKVALEVASGASIAGARALCAMKHVGLNVAADPLMTLSYTGVGGGLVVVTADDPGHHSSQNEQDNRNYAAFSKIPMLEPSDSAEALAFTRLAFDLSEEFDTPVLVRTTTRVSHSKTVASPGRPVRRGRLSGPVPTPEKYVMIPGISEGRHVLAEERLVRLREYAEGFAHNTVEVRGRDIGVITSGISYQYVKEAMPDASVLKLGMSYPLPRKMLARFIKSVKDAYVVEELDPFIEAQALALGLRVTGKLTRPGFLPLVGELSPDIVARAFGKGTGVTGPPGPALPLRPPALCPGCPHRGVFYTLKRLGYFVAGDIGCYTLAHAKPLSAVHTTLCMGAGIGQAHGIRKAMETDAAIGVGGGGGGGGGDVRRPKVAAVIGDSTFMHSGMTGLLNTFYNRGGGVVVILDNGTTAMTGLQGHPGSGGTLDGGQGGRADIKGVVRGMGISDVSVVDPYDLKALERLLLDAPPEGSPRVIIARRPCVLLGVKGKRRAFSVDTAKCAGCGDCLGLACPALGLVEGKACIDAAHCTGCALCKQVCTYGAVCGRNELRPYK